jgi:hypothetical protein
MEGREKMMGKKREEREMNEENDERGGVRKM